MVLPPSVLFPKLRFLVKFLTTVGTIEDPSLVKFSTVGTDAGVSFRRTLTRRLWSNDKIEGQEDDKCKPDSQEPDEGSALAISSLPGISSDPPGYE